MRRARSRTWIGLAAALLLGAPALAEDPPARRGKPYLEAQLNGLAPELDRASLEDLLAPGVDGDAAAATTPAIPAAL